MFKNPDNELAILASREMVVPYRIFKRFVWSTKKENKCYHAKNTMKLKSFKKYVKNKS